MKGYIGVDAALVRATWGVLGRCAAKWGTPWSDGRVPLADRSAPVVGRLTSSARNNCIDGLYGLLRVPVEWLTHILRQFDLLAPLGGMSRG